MSRKTVTSQNAPAAVGPYSQAVWNGNTLFMSGQIPLDPKTGKVVEGDVSAQAQQVFTNIKAVLEEAGLSLEHAVKLTVFLTDMNDFAAVNAVYEKQFEAPYPARSAIAVAALPLGVQVEIEVIARR